MTSIFVSVVLQDGCGASKLVEMDKVCSTRGFHIGEPDIRPVPTLTELDLTDVHKSFFGVEPCCSFAVWFDAEYVRSSITAVAIVVSS